MPILFWLLFYFVFGLIVGSFLNVWVLRYGTGKTMLGRSGCLCCGKKLHIYNLIPVLSFVFQRGKCTSCKSKISIQYPIVELAGGVLFSLAFFILKENNIDLLFHLIFISLLIAITAYDIKHKIIPDGMVFGLFIVSLLRIIFVIWPNSISNFVFLSYILSGLVLSLFFFLLWFISKGKWMGLGDAKLVLAIGLWFPIWTGTFAIMVSFWSGAIVGLLLLLFSRLKPDWRYFTMKSEIPFAPFIVLGFIVAFLFPINANLFF